MQKKITFLSLVLLFFLFSQSAFSQASTVKGKVTNSLTGEPLSGATVKVLGSNLGTQTSTDGEYSLNAVSNATLVFSFVGFETLTLKVNGQSTLNAALVAGKVSDLNEVVVVGYGTQKKRDLTGSIAVVSGDEISKQPNTNPIASLEGKVAGLTIVNGGGAGAGPTVRIRGVNSTNNSDPLYVVDGIQQNDISYVNPSDIESVEVLKDPSSTAIYGLQGGSGVIIINTKRAKKGKTLFNVNSYTGVQNVQNKIKVVDATGFKKLYSEQLSNIGGAPFDYTNYTANTNWQDQIFRVAPITNTTFSASSSTDKGSSLISLGYIDQNGVIKYDDVKKYIIRLSEELNVTKNFRIGGEVNGYYYQTNPANANVSNALWAAPIIPIQAGPGLYYTTPSFQRAQVGNPVAGIDNSKGNTVSDGFRTSGNVHAELTFLKYFNFRSVFSTDISSNFSRGYSALPFHYINIGEGSIKTDTTYDTSVHTGVNQSESHYRTFQQDHTLTFDRSFSNHHIVALAGFSTLYHYNDYINGSRTDTTLNIPNDPNLWYLNVVQSSNPGNFGGGASSDASTSYFGRVNYSFLDRYLLNVSFRRDGTSKFAPKNRWGNFGSVGAGWVLSSEPFLKDISWVDFLKVKASWGVLGNALNIQNYLPYPGLNNSIVGVFGNNVYPAVTAAYVADPNLHWERVEGKDAGFESILFANRLSFDIDLYDRTTHDILTQLTLPGASGNTTYFTNLGSIDNKGIEITASVKDKITSDLSYSIGGNFSVNENKVLSIGNNIDFQISNGPNLTQSGSSIGYFYGYVQTGIFQTAKQIAETPHLTGAEPGDIIYKDVNGDGKIDQNDRTNLGSPFPKFNFGGNFTLNYKGFDLGLTVQGVAGNKIYVQRRTATFAILNYESNRLNAWTGPGTTNVEPILDNTRSNNYLFSTYWLEPGDYVRLRNAELGYSFSSKLLSRIGVNQLHLYLSGQNLITLTKATGYSPEVPIGNPTSGGIDNGVYPVPAVYTIGLNLTF